MSGLRVIFFDAVGTLIHLPRGPAWHYCEVARRHGLALPLEAFDAAFRKAWKETLPPTTTQTPRPDDDRGWWEALVDRVLDTCAADAHSFDRRAYFRELYEEFAKPGVWDVYPETRAVVTELACRFELSVISNFDRRLRTVLEHLDLSRFFRRIVLSSEVGANKPDPWIFSEALRLSGATPKEALHVGDDPAADWEGAARAGMRIFKLQRGQTSLRSLALELNA